MRFFNEGLEDVRILWYNRKIIFNKYMNISNKGFAPIIILIAALLIAGLGGYVYFQSQENPIISTTTTVSDPVITTTITGLSTTTKPTTTTSKLTSVTNWSCGDSVTFNYKGDLATYGTVESQDRCWLDRNLGASRVATAFNDSLSYGDLFQWGRGDDGHQNRDSGVTSTLSATDNPGHSNFIYSTVTPFDWRSPQNTNLWQGVRGINNPCPNGWRLPTRAEWEAELASWSRQGYHRAFASHLKLPAAGARYLGEATHAKNMGTHSFYWSSEVWECIADCETLLTTGPEAYFVLYQDLNSDIVLFPLSSTSQMLGLSVRCIKN